MFFVWERKNNFVRIIEYMEKEPTDERLVELSLQNQGFFAILVSRYEEKFLRYIKRRTRVSGKDAEDILQEIFIKIYINLNGFDPSLKFLHGGIELLIMK